MKNNQLFYLLIFFISLFISSYLIDKFSSLFYLSVLILTISFIYSIIIVKKINIQLLKEMINKITILSLSILSSLIIAIVLPFLIYHNFNLNLYLIQYTYLFPLTIIFFLFFKIYFHVFNQIKIDFKKIIIKSTTYAILISLVFSLFLTIMINQQYNERSNMYYESFESIEEMISFKNPELQIFQEIKNFELKIIDEINEKNSEFIKFDKNKGLCIINNCEKIMFEKIFSMVMVITEHGVIRNYVNVLEQEYDFITSEEFSKNFESLEEYKLLLKNKLKDIDKTDESSTIMDPNHLESFLHDKFPINSLFFNSLNHVLFNSRLYNVYMNYITKTEKEIFKARNNNRLYEIIYDNKNIEESIESKTIRYRILLSFQYI